MNWIRVGLVAMSVLPRAIGAIERLKGSSAGAEKRAAGKELVMGVLDGLEDGTGRDILNDPEVAKAYDAVNDAIVAFHNILARKVAAAGG